MTCNEINHLMYSPIFNNVFDPNYWTDIQERMNENCIEPECLVNATNIVVHFSWAGVAIVSDTTYKSFRDIICDPYLCDLIKAEIYVQSKWFIADNSLDNTKGHKYNLEGIQTFLSYMEYSQAELDNEISANMSTFFKMILAKIVLTSEIRKLYKSVISQIQTQKKLKEAEYEDKKAKNRLVVNGFLAIFTAASLYKTVIELIKNDYSKQNIIIFAFVLLLSLGIVVFEYYDK